MNETMQFLLELVNQGGIVAVLIIISVVLGYWTKRLYDDQRNDLKNTREELEKLIAPTLDRYTTILDKQDRINNNMLDQLDSQRQILEKQRHLIEEQADLFRDLSKDVATMRRFLPDSSKRSKRK